MSKWKRPRVTESLFDRELQAKTHLWCKVMEERGHTPARTEDGKFDTFYHDAYTCNGPGCTTCGWNCCWHCARDPVAAVPPCTAVPAPAERASASIDDGGGGGGVGSGPAAPVLEQREPRARRRKGSA